MLLLLVVHGQPGREKSHLKDHPGPGTKLVILDGLPLTQRSLIPLLQRLSKAGPVPEVSHLAILTKLDTNLESQHRSLETLLPLPLAIQAKLLLQASEHLNIYLPLLKPQILLLFGH